ncbi:MAG: hypothetical protein KAV99_00195, partial [Candidatus Latescibacteria bacterium]|nr:hypothetical protein [Candidatus Latescibacterota bacterium]
FQEIASLLLVARNDENILIWLVSGQTLDSKHLMGFKAPSLTPLETEFLTGLTNLMRNRNMKIHVTYLYHSYPNLE